MSNCPSGKMDTLLYQNQLEYFHELEDGYEQKLSRMSLAELTLELQQAQENRETVKTVVIEHMMALRHTGRKYQGSRWPDKLKLIVTLSAIVLAFFLGQLSAN